MFEATIRLACLVFGGIVIIVTLGLGLYFMSNESFGDDIPIVEMLVGGIAIGGGFVGFGLWGESFNQ